MEKFVPYKQPAAALRGQRLHLVELRVPARGAHHDAPAQRQHRAHIFNGRLGRREVHNHIHAGQVRRRQRRRVRILVDIERAHAVAALPRHLGHQRAGLSFAQNQNQHEFLRNSFTVLSS